jgi:Zn2+/Cd2+-exporting ATPase
VSELAHPLGRVGRSCGTCGSGARRFTGPYPDCLLDSGTPFTLASGLLVVAAIVVHPGGVVSSNEGSAGPLFIAAAFTGCVCIWRSGIPGIRERDFTADIPVTVAAIAIDPFSEVAVNAVLCLAGRMLVEVVAARSGSALESLERLLPTETQ